MTAIIIAIVNQKGGAGKTTVTMQVGGTLSLRGKKVQVIDGDGQQSALQWASLAPEGSPFPAKVCGLHKAGIKIHQEIKKLVYENDFILVDCPPAADSPIAKSALLVSDIALVPFIPSALDMLAAVEIRETIESAQILNPTLRGLLVLNRVEKTSLTKTVLDLLPDFNMPVAKTKLNKRTHYAECVLSGATVHMFKNKGKEAIDEIENFCDELLSFITNNSAEIKEIAHEQA